MPFQKRFPLLRKLFVLIGAELSKRYFSFVPVVLAVLITLPALNLGWVMDDMGHRALLLGSDGVVDKPEGFFGQPVESDSLLSVVNNLYSFVRPEVNLNRSMDYGLLPWWSYEKLRISFWRPLTSFTLWLDYQLFPDSAPLMHMHSIIWFGVGVFLVVLMYRKLIGPVWIAGFAGLLYALDESYYIPVAMMANRHILLSMVFGLLAFFAHLRWRRDKSPMAVTIAVICFALSLLSGEGGVMVLVYIFTYALVLDTGKTAKRGLSLVPYFIVLVFWRIIYNVLGHGSYGNSFYVDPVREPLFYAVVVLKRIPMYLQGQFGPLPSIMYMMFSSQMIVIAWLISVVFVAFVLIMFFPMIRGNRLARFWFLGMLLSLLPICATVPMNRNLFFVGIGAMALISQFIAGIFTKAIWVPKSTFWKVLAWSLCLVLLLVHLEITGLSRVNMPSIIKSEWSKVDRIFEIEMSENCEKQDVVLVNVCNPGVCSGLPSYMKLNGLSLPRSIRQLSLGFSGVEVFRSEDKVLLLRSREGSLLSLGNRPNRPHCHYVYLNERFNNLFLSRSHPFRPGDRIELPRMSVDVLGVDNRGRPREVEFRFDVSLDDFSLIWLQWNWKTQDFSPFKVPAIGQSVYLAGPFN